MKTKGMVQRPHKSKIAGDSRHKAKKATWDKRGEKRK